MADGSTPFYKRHGFWLFIGFVVSAACLWFAMKDLVLNAENRRKMYEAFRDADYRTLPLIWLVLLAFYWLKSWRWAMLLSPVGKFSPTKELFQPVLIGFAINNITPAHLGDFARVFLFARRNKVSNTAVLSTVVLERVFDIIAILFFLGAGLFFVEGLNPKVRQSALVFGAASACGVLGALVYVIWTPWFVRVAEWGMDVVPILPVGIRKKIAGIMEAGAHGLASLKSFRSLAGIMATSLAQWALNGFLVYLSIWSFNIHVDSPLLVSCIVLGVVAFSVTVPSTPGYFGVIQAAFSLALELFTTKEQEASVFAASVYFHLSQYFPVTALGLIFLAMSGFRMKDMQSAAAAEKAAPEANAADNNQSPHAAVAVSPT